MDGGSQICDGPTSRQPAGQPNLEKMAARAPQGGPGPPPFFQMLAGWLAHHIFGFPHPFLGYIIGIGILLDII